MPDYHKLKIAVIDEELPYPATSGKRIRTLNLLLRLAERHELILICNRNADPAEASQAIKFLADHGIATVVAKSAPPAPSALRGGAAFYSRLAMNLLSPLPYIVTANCTPQLRQAIRRHAATQSVDLWHCEWTPLSHLLAGLDEQPQVVVAHNVESTIWQRYHETETQPAKRWYIKRQWIKLQRFERDAFRAASRVVAVSECDAARIRDDFGASNVDVVENGVDTKFFELGDSPRRPGQILFLGSLDWRPNLDAVRMLLTRVFPIVQRTEPTARLVIVGRNPPDWLRRQAGENSAIELHANVPDVRPFIHRSSVMTVPLRIGGGSRLKILEALAAGLPVVSTAVGAEGLALKKDVHYFEAESPEEMAERLVACIRQPGAALECARRGRQVVLDRYDWDGLADKLDQVWRDAVTSEASAAVLA